MRYLPKSDQERREMLDAIGAASVEELFAHIPASDRQKRPLDIPDGLSEFEVLRYFRERADENARGFVSFLGAGVYQHFRPVVIDALISRSEFYTAYTPYQPEISQGTLQSIFEFQSMICQLTGMEVANASMYDGSTAVPEAVMMAVRVTGRRKVLIARSVHPEYRQVLHTYTQHQGITVEETAFDPQTGQAAAFEVDKETAAVLVQSPNFFGIIEDIDAIAGQAQAAGALLIVAIGDAVSLGIVKPPAAADIVTMETQPFGIAPSYGGPFAGVIAAREKYVRQLPGRLVGQTVDSDGRRGFCLTLATREQHIRREKATSNICTNQALFALMATIFMAVYGKGGLRALAGQNVAKSHYAASKVPLVFGGPFFNEFVVHGRRTKNLLDRRILGGLNLRKFYPELGEALLVCVTEIHTREQIDQLVGELA